MSNVLVCVCARENHLRIVSIPLRSSPIVSTAQAAHPADLPVMQKRYLSWNTGGRPGIVDGGLAGGVRGPGVGAVHCQQFGLGHLAGLRGHVQRGVPLLLRGHTGSATHVTHPNTSVRAWSFNTLVNHHKLYQCSALL